MIKFGASFTKKNMADTEFGPGTEFFEGMIGSENKVPGHKKVGARFPPNVRHRIWAWNRSLYRRFVVKTRYVVTKKNGTEFLKGCLVTKKSWHRFFVFSF